MKKILVTGAAGFIGRHCLPLLAGDGVEVHAVSSRPLPQVLEASEAPLEAAWHQADLLDARQAATLMETVRPTHLLHLAWIVTPGLYWTSPDNFRWVQASLELLRLFAAGGGQRVVTAGTCAEYDWSYGYCSEGVTPLAPCTPYGVCKYSLGLLQHSWAEQAGLSAAWGRIFFPYGPHEAPSRLVPSVMRSLLRGEPALCSHGEQVRDFLYVEDVAAAFVALLRSEVAGPVNIASGRAVALKEIVAMIAQQQGKSDLLRLGALPAPSGEPPLLVADVRRLREEVGWQAPSGLREGLSRTLEWWRTRGGVL